MQAHNVPGPQKFIHGKTPRFTLSLLLEMAGAGSHQFSIPFP